MSKHELWIQVALLQIVSFIVSPCTATLPHAEPEPADKYFDYHHTQENDKRDNV